MPDAVAAPSEIVRLVELFDRNRADYRSGRYNEARLRREFLDPLFAALGWDMDNRQGHAEAYKEVIYEDSIRVEGAVKAPDYCFRIGSTPKFFVEAKKPAVDIRTSTSPAFQVRRYAWTAKLPLSILTDFEELAVYDCRYKPDKKDKPSTARVMYLKYTDYPKRWGEIADIFAKESILTGSFDRYADSTKKKRGTADVDDAFLEEIEAWRTALAKNIYLRNPGLSDRELNFSVQRVIDRVIFLRMCEGRGIERYGQLQALSNGKNIYKRLCELFDRADEKYNSGLFHFHKEKGREPPDEITPALTVDDKPLKDIFARLYYPESPYEFAALPADILGQVYEQFLGKVIRHSGRGVRVENKPEVKKAGGVYYTPTYIVDYIVEHTVGELLKDKTPRQADRLKILDPACGSGSFLIVAYQTLLDWYLGQYVKRGPGKHKQKIYKARAGEWRLTTAERKRILLNNIHGVDIDFQAVEVTKLSLLLKVLEGESEETLAAQFKLFHKERALPDLADNIKCGNSLIGPDFYHDSQMRLLDEDEQYRVNVFDWKAEFPEVFAKKNPGFDAVIGNPPYIRIQNMRKWAPEEASFFSAVYQSSKKGNYDIYVVFVERAFGLLNSDGYLAFILPSKFFATDYGESLRRLISSRKSLRRVVDFRHGQVFSGATTYTCLLFLSQRKLDAFHYFVALPPTALIESDDSTLRKIASNTLSEATWSFASDTEKSINRKLLVNSTPFLELPAKISRGSSTGADDVFMLRKDGRRYFTRDGEPVQVEKDLLRVPIYASDFNRYLFSPRSDEHVIFPYRVTDGGYVLLRETELRERFPNAYDYLVSRKRELLERKQYKQWYAFSAPRNLDDHTHAHIMIPLLANRGLYCLLPSEMNNYCPMASGGFSVTLAADVEVAPEYVLGLINSRLLFWRLQNISNLFRGGWITCTKQYFGTLPIWRIDFSVRHDAKIHEHVVACVKNIMRFNESLISAKTPHQRTSLERQIDTTDRQIDQFVYELYGLTDEEIQIVEEATEA